jgi:predicted kinase
MTTLYMMMGYPGAGKSTTAAIIADLTGAVHLHSDQLRLELFPNPAFTQEEHAELYRVLDEKTAALLKEGKSVIYDANLNRYQHRQEKYDICEATGAKSILLWVKTPQAIAKDRATHFSRAVFVPQHETPAAMFDRIANIIEEPGTDEPYIEVDGTKVTKEYILSLLG